MNGDLAKLSEACFTHLAFTMEPKFVLLVEAYLYSHRRQMQRLWPSCSGARVCARGGQLRAEGLHGALGHTACQRR